MPEVSVIIPAYNRSGTIRRAVDSVLSQSFTDFEVLVVDDASTDNTREIVQGLIDPRVHLLALAENGGVARARNAGVSEAKGRWIAFLDSDDFWLPDKLKKQLLATADAVEPENTFCAHPHYIDDGGPKRRWPARGPGEGECMADYLFVANGNIQTSNWLLHRELCARFPFESEFRRHEDWDVLMRMEQAGAQFVWIDEPLSVFECHPLPNRLSEVVDAQYSADFLEKRRALFTPGAQAAFEARIIAHQLWRGGNKKAAAPMLFRAATWRALGTREYVKFLVWLCLPALHASLVKQMGKPNPAKL